MKKTVWYVLCAAMIAAGLLLAVYYGGAEGAGYLCLSVLCTLESVLTLCALILRGMKKHGTPLTVLQTLACILWIPVALLAAIWGLYLLGVELLPPPQR